MASAETTELPALKIARDLLAGQLYPDPEECLKDLDVVTALFYVEQWAEALVVMWTGYLSAEDQATVDLDGQLATVHQTITEVAGMLVAACAIVGVLPPEAVAP